MIKKIKFILVKFVFLKIYLYLFFNKFYPNTYAFNFKNILFNNTTHLKKIFLSDKYINEKINDNNAFYFHSFDWLNTGKKLGGAENVRRSKKHIFNWRIKNYSKRTYIWNSNFNSKRFINIIYNYDFFAISATKKETNLLHSIILEHYLLIKLEIESKKIEETTIEEYQSILLGNLIYRNNREAIQKKIIPLLASQIDNTGFHKSYNPLRHAEFLNQIHELKNMMLFFKIPIPKELEFQLINMTSLLLSLTHKDKSIALFNGSSNFYKKEVNQLIEQISDIKPKNNPKIEHGLATYTDKNKKIFMDVVNPFNHIINKNLHAGTLSFELSCSNEKIITNCGSVENRMGTRPEYLRYSAAHSTIILNNTNVSELIEKKSYVRIPKNITFDTFDTENFVTWLSSHDGYIDNYKKIIKRKLHIFKNKDKIVGEDSIMSTKLKSDMISYSIRFHLMPNISSLITNDQKSILIKTPSNQKWVFKSSSKLKLENSIYIGGGKSVEQSKQIVINGNINDNKKTENWSITKS